MAWMVLLAMACGGSNADTEPEAKAPAKVAEASRSGGDEAEATAVDDLPTPDVPPTRADPSPPPAEVEPEAEPPGAATPSPSKAVAVEPRALEPATIEGITAARLRAHVMWLADDERGGRATPSPGLDAAADYLREHYERVGLVAPEAAPQYLQTFECGRPGSASNVIGKLPGRDPTLADEAVIVSAHYDHLGERAWGDDAIMNGANDDASGTAAVLAIAEALASAPPRRSVLFIAFCGEELGLRGSRHYVTDPAHPLDQTVAMVNLEMLGRPGAEESPPAWVTGSEHSDLIDWLRTANDGQPLRFVDGREIGSVEGSVYDRSDNYPLAQRGVVAHSISFGPLDDHYHAPFDEADTLDYARMAVVVKGIARGVHRLAEQDGRPQPR